MSWPTVQTSCFSSPMISVTTPSVPSGMRRFNPPHIDDLVERGTVFSDAYIMGGSCSAVCQPSRAMLMTGKTLYRLQGKGGQIPHEHTMLGETLRQAGYDCFGTANGTMVPMPMPVRSPTERRSFSAVWTTTGMCPPVTTTPPVCMTNAFHGLSISTRSRCSTRSPTTCEPAVRRCHHRFSPSPACAGCAVLRLLLFHGAP